MGCRDELTFGIEYEDDRNAPGLKGLEGVERVVDRDFRHNRMFFQELANVWRWFIRDGTPRETVL